MRWIVAPLVFVTSAVALTPAWASGPPAYVGRVLYGLGSHLPGAFDTYQTDEPSSQTAAGGEVAGGGYTYLSDGSLSQPQAVVWTGPNGVAVNLNPGQTGATSSLVEGTNGAQQVGYAYGVNRPDNDHAVAWTGTAASAVDLNPVGALSYIDNSFAFATDGSHQVGYGYGDTTGGSVHALLWAGSAASAVDLAPTELTQFDNTFAYGVRGGQQVGAGYGTGTGGNFHGLLWNGTAASAVDLNPTNLGPVDTSVLSDTTGTQQVGAFGGDATGGDLHAALWAGTPDSAVDLNPAGVVNSVVNGTDGLVQAGVGYDDPSAEVNHALLWAGTAASAVDLEPLLAGGTWDSSDAYTVDADGDVFGTATGTYGGVADTFAVEWVPAAVPEPATIGSVAVVAGLVCRRQRRAGVRSRAGRG